ncbi:MAG: substrate-binding domain-containing protein [Phycisphaerae bacterium]
MVTRWDLLASGQPFPQMLLNALRVESRRRGLLVTAYSFDPDYDPVEQGPTHLDLDLQNGRVDALLVSGLSSQDEQRMWSLGKPCVFLTQSRLLTPALNMRMETMIVEGVRSLLRLGRRRIGLAYEVDPGNVAPSNRCLETFQQALQAEGVTENINWRMTFKPCNEYLRMVDASRQFHQLWANEAGRPDGLLSVNDQFTAGLLHAAEVLGVRMPQELVVASHSNKGLELFDAAEVVRLEYDPAQIAQMLLQAAEDLLNSKPVEPIQEVPLQVRWPKAWKISKASGGGAGAAKSSNTISVAAGLAEKTLVS